MGVGDPVLVAVWKGIPLSTHSFVFVLFGNKINDNINVINIHFFSRDDSIVVDDVL